MALLRNFFTVGAATALSRVLGFGRDMLMAAALGTGMVADAFFVAFRFPNLFRRVFAEGAFNAAFVPLFARKLEGDGAHSARHFAEQALAGLLFILVVLTALAQITMPVLMYGLAPGFSETPEKFDLAVLLTRICFPYLIFVSLLALVSGLLNALGKFAAAAFAPVLLNVVLIGTLTLILASDLAENPTAGVYLAWGVFAGGVAQLVMVLYAARREGMAPRLVRPVWNADIRRLVGLAIPGVIAGGITQINILVGTIIASMQAGAVSYLYYADRVYQLPLGIVGIAIGVVLLPDIARRLQAGDETAALGQQNRALEFAMLLTLPAAVALFLVPGEIISGLFQRGAFDAAASAATAPALAAFALGLPGFVLIKVFSPGFFAREDTKTPMRFAAINAGINIALSLALFPHLAHVGIAIATAIAGSINAALLGLTLYRRGHFQPDPALLARMVRALLACGAMGLALVAVVWGWHAWFGGPATQIDRLGLLAALVLTGLGVFAVSAIGLGAVDRTQLRAALRRR
jgi:putative peptidoglycan lipid II flippase